MDGILLLDKPAGWTSFDVIRKLRGATRERKTGHAGTLDPMATGVLPILFGRATKVSDRLPNLQKHYRAGVKFGVVTDTQDTTGAVLEKHAPAFDRPALRKALEAFQGTIRQVPPMYSAVQVGGKRLYDLARRGIEVEREARAVEIFEMALLDFSAEEGTAVLDILCSKGTYVRTICHDLGRMLGCGAAMCSLRRTMSSGFFLEDCVTLEEALSLCREEGGLERRLLPVSAAFEALPKLPIGQWQKKMLQNGVRLDLQKVGGPQAGTYTVWCDGEFLGLGEAADVFSLKQI